MSQLSTYALPHRVASRLVAAMVALVLAVGVVLAVPSPVHAAQVTVKDKKGDAAANIDILRAKYTNADSYVAWRWEVRDIESDAFLYGTTLQTCDGACSDYFQLQVTHKNGELELTLREGGSKAVACKGMQGTWANKTGVVTARVPKKCIVGPGELFMQVFAYDGPQDPDNKYDIAPGKNVARG